MIECNCFLRFSQKECNEECMQNKKAMKAFYDKVERDLWFAPKCDCVFAYGGLKYCDGSCKQDSITSLNKSKTINLRTKNYLQGDLTEEEYKNKFKKFNRY